LAQKKLQRFAELETFPNVFQFPLDMKGNWKRYFKNTHPITLELACGKGEYALGLGRLYPQRNLIGIDIKGNRIWVGAKKAMTERLENIAFLRIQIDQLNNYFSPAEVNEIWITFPDPQLRFSKAKKRLTHPKFLRLYQQILSPGGYINLKTDSPDLYRFTKLVIEHYGCDLLEDNENVFGSSAVPEELKIRTHYESLDIAGSQRIHYLRFSLPIDLGGKEKDDQFREKLKEYEGMDRGGTLLPE
jgi:tRNA (guanine-N7-)-methyltransferase